MLYFVYYPVSCILYPVSCFLFPPRIEYILRQLGNSSRIIYLESLHLKNPLSFSDSAVTLSPVYSLQDSEPQSEVETLPNYDSSDGEVVASRNPSRNHSLTSSGAEYGEPQ